MSRKIFHCVILLLLFVTKCFCVDYLGRVVRAAGEETRSDQTAESESIKVSNEALEEKQQVNEVSERFSGEETKHRTRRDAQSLSSTQQTPSESTGNVATSSLQTNTTSQPLFTLIYQPQEATTQGSSRATRPATTQASSQQRNATSQPGNVATSSQQTNATSQPLFTLIYQPQEATTQDSSSPTTSPPPAPKCAGQFSCKARCQSQRDPGPLNATAESQCYCDPECDYFQDCCADYDSHCSLPHSRRPETWRCIRQDRHANPDTVAGLWMISDCPANWRISSVHWKCISVEELSSSNYDSVVPVVSADGRNFKNRHCAHCNGVPAGELSFYGLDLQCHLSPPEGYSRTETIKFLLKFCSNVEWEPKQGQHRRQCFEVKSECRWPQSPTLKHNCTQSPYRVVFFQQANTNYKNIYCAYCINPWLNDVTLSCGPTPPRGSAQGPPRPFSIVLDIKDDSDTQTPKYEKARVLCGNGEVYDSFLEMCRRGYKSDPAPVLSRFDKYRVALWVTFYSLERTRLDHISPGNIMDSFRETFQINSSVTFVDAYSIPENPIVILLADVQLDNSEAVQGNQPSVPRNQAAVPRTKRAIMLTFDSILDFKQPIMWVIRNQTFTILKATTRMLSCIHAQHYPPGEYTVIGPSGNVYINSTGEVLQEKEYYVNETTRWGAPVGTIVICRQRVATKLHKSCNGSFIILEKHEYFIYPNRSLYHNATGRDYGFRDYTLNSENSTVTLCTNFTESYYKKRRTNISDKNSEKALTSVELALVVLTYIGLILSIVCLVFVLVTYVLFKELRTLPGVNLMNLSGALLLVHLLFLAGTGQTSSHTVCVAIAAVLHFAFMASFVWMSVIAFDTWRAFSGNSGQSAMRSDKRSRQKRILKRLAVGWLPVLALVVILVSLDQSGTVDIRYGGSKGCWINNGRANLYIFIIPVSLALLWNAVFFGLTVKSIREIKEQSRAAVTERDNKRDYSIYVKLASLMGFAWLFGILAVFVSEYFQFPFVIFNTLQGVFIAASFTFTPRVLKLYHERIRGPHEDSLKSRETEREHRLVGPTKSTTSQTQL